MKYKVSKQTLGLVAAIAIALIAMSAYLSSYLGIVHTYTVKVNLPFGDYAKSVTLRVSKLAQLPQDESPQVFTIGDASKLPDDPFFSEAENGDEYLVWQKNQLRILFRPSANSIVNEQSASSGLQPGLSQ